MGRTRNEEKYQNSLRMQKALAKFNETGNTKFLFDCYNDFKHAIKSIIVKRFKGGTKMWGPFQWEYCDEVSDDLTLQWFQSFKRRREKGKPAVMISPISCAYFFVLGHYPKDDRYWLTNYQLESETEEFLSYQSSMT